MLVHTKERSGGNRKLYLVGNCFGSGLRTGISGGRFNVFFLRTSYVVVSSLTPKYRSSRLPSTFLQVYHPMLLFNSRLRTMHNIKYPFMRTEKEPAQDQRFPFIHGKLWEQETEQKGCRKI